MCSKIKQMKIIITFIDHDLSEQFNGTEILEHKTIYSSTKILKDLEDEIIKNYFNNRVIEEAYLIDYDTTGDRHCIFHLKNKQIAENGDCAVSYEYETTIS